MGFIKWPTQYIMEAWGKAILREKLMLKLFLVILVHIHMQLEDNDHILSNTIAIDKVVAGITNTVEKQYPDATK